MGGKGPRALLALCAFLLCASCGQPAAAYEQQNLPGAGAHRKKPLVVSAPCPVTSNRWAMLSGLSW